MQELQRKKLEQQRLREALDALPKDPTAQEKVEKLSELHFVKNQKIFAEQYTSIHEAAFHGNISAVSHFLNEKVRGQRKPKTHDRDETGKCPIHHASENGHAHIIEYLITKGGSVNIPAEDGTTAMMFACKGNHLGAVETLFNLGADLMLRNRNTMSAMHYAAVSDNLEAMTMCMDLMSTRKLALIHDSAAAAEASLDKAADEVTTLASISAVEADLMELGDNAIIEIATDRGLRPLHMAAMHDSTRCLDYLLRQRVDIHAVDIDQDTALHKAGRCQFFVSYRMLKASGCREDVKNKVKETPKKLLIDDISY